MSLPDDGAGRLAPLLQSWDRYWFQPASLSRLGACRLLAFGALIAKMLFCDADFLSYTPDPFFWSPNFIFRFLRHAFGLGIPSPATRHVIYWLALAVSFGAFVGYRTRLCAAASAALFLYINALKFSWFRNTSHELGAFAILLAALALSPCGEALSVDGVLARMRESVARLELRRAHRALLSPFARWPLQLTGTILCLNYFLAAYAKLRWGGLEWMNGHTVAYTMRWHEAYFGVDVPLQLASRRTLLAVLSAATLALELTFPVILFAPRLVWIYLPAGLALHIGLHYSMRLLFFWYWWTYIVFIDWDEVGRWIRSRTSQAAAGRLVVAYDRGCPWCLRMTVLMDALDWFGRLSFQAGSRGTLSGRAGLRRRARELPLLWPLLPLFYLHRHD